MSKKTQQFTFHAPVHKVTTAEKVTNTYYIEGAKKEDEKERDGPTMSTSATASRENLSVSTDNKGNSHSRVVNTAKISNATIQDKHIIRCADYLELHPRFLHNMKRGYVAIINNVDFQVPWLKKRDGSEKDVEALDDFFHNDLAWNHSVLKPNLTASEIEEFVKILAGKDYGQWSISAFFLVILSHGCAEGIYGVDGKVVVVEELLENFSARCCRTLAGVPKIFIMQACRGNLDDQGYPLRESDNVTENPCNAPMVQIPEFGDFLIAYPCSPNYTALRRKKHGTYYIQTLVHIFKQFYGREHLLDMLLKVNFVVAGTVVGELGNIQSMPSLDVRLRMKCYFNQYFLNLTNFLSESGELQD